MVRGNSGQMESNMHICHIITRGDIIGGAQVHVRDLILEQLKKNSTVSIICGDGSTVFSALSDMKVNIYCLNEIKRSINLYHDVCAIIKITKLIKTIRPDIIACHTSKAGILGRISGKIAKVKTVYTPHGWIFSEPNHKNKSKIFFVIEKAMATLCNKIITVSNFDYNLAKQLKLSHKDKLIRIHNGIPDIQHNLVKSTYKNNKIIKLISVARLEDPKDFGTLFNALSQLTNGHWQLDIFGDGSQREILEKQCVTLDIKERINFHGDCFNISEQLFNSDIFLLISKSEGFPISIIEAMRAGLPVIASHVGGVPEAVDHGKTGLLVEKENTADLHSAIAELSKNKLLIEKFGKQGRAYYKKYFSSEKMANKTLDMYRELLANC